MVAKVYKPVYSETSIKSDDVLTVGALRAILADAPDNARVVISRLERDGNRFFTHETVVSEVFAANTYKGAMGEIHIVLNENNGGGAGGRAAEDFFCVWERPRVNKDAMDRARAVVLNAIRTSEVIPEVRYREPGCHPVVSASVLVDVSSIAPEELDEILDDAYSAFVAECGNNRRNVRLAPVLLVKHGENYLAFNGKRDTQTVADVLSTTRVPGQPQHIEVTPRWGMSLGDIVTGACAIRRYLQSIGVDAVVHTSLNDKRIPVTSNDPATVITAAFRQ